MEILSTFVLLVLLVLLLDYLTKPKHGNIVPNRIPIIGHALMFWGQNPLNKLGELSQKYGKVYTIQILNKHYVILHGYDAIHEALFTKGKELAGRVESFRSYYIVANQDIATQDMCPQWKRLRQLVHSILKQYSDGLTRIEDIAVDIAEEMVESLQTSCDKTGYIDPHDDIYLAVVNTLCSMLSGKRYTIDDKAFQKYIRFDQNTINYIQSTETGVELEIFPWLRHFGNYTFKILKEQKVLCDDVYNSIKDESLQYGADFSNVTVKLLEEIQNGSSMLDETSIKWAVVDIMGAGIATSTRTLYCFLQILCRYPKVQENIFEEITKCQRQGNKQSITLTDKKDMPYTSASLSELLRYSSIIPFGFPHKALVDTSIQGINVPKGSAVVTNLWHLHHDETYWNDPYKFCPERFLDENGGILRADHVNMKHLLVFGAGPRMCIGQKLAQSRLFIFVTSILRKFKIEADDFSEGVHDCRNYKVGLVLNPQRSKMRFIARENGISN